MTIAHISDLHFYHFPHWTGILTKRMIGLANLYLRGRIRRFDTAIARQAILSVIADNPDLVIISGDLTALGSPSEFAIARAELEPLIERFPVVLVPGNHDFYTRGAARSNRIEEYFGGVMRSPGSPEDAPLFPSLHISGQAAVIGLNPNRYTWAAAGKLREDELFRLEGLLRLPEVAGKFIVMVLHYPLLNEGGRITRMFWRRLSNPEKLLNLLERHRVDLLLHGHDHHRYNNLLPGGGSGVQPTLLANAGSASRMPNASYNLYRVEKNDLAEVTFKDWRLGRFQATFQGPPARIPHLHRFSPKRIEG